MTKIIKQFQGSFYGFLVGDAMGVPVEFCDRESLINNPVIDMLGYGSYDVPKGSWSDDSSMTIATMDSIISKNKIDYKDMADKFLEWINNAKYSSVSYVFDIGTTTKKALQRYQGGLNPLESGLEGINYNGNGSIMRMLPLAFYAKIKNLSESEIIDLACDASSITHRHEISCIGCYIYIRYVMFLLDGFDRYISYEKIKKLDYSAFKEENLKEYRRLLNTDFFNYPLSEISSSGYVVHTLEASLWCIGNTDSFKEAIIGAINLGEDTDTIGAITGSLAGIIYGFEDIPKNWINNLQKKDYINWIYTSFIKTLTNLSVK